jgi:ABC-2 type transport system ATP-binding protein
VQEQFPASVIRLPVGAWPQGRALPKDCDVRNGYIELFSEEVPTLLERLDQAGADLGELRVETPNLEDLFLKLTGHALRS